MTLKIPNFEDEQHLDFARSDVNVTKGPSADARAIYARRLAASLDGRAVPALEEATILGSPDVGASFAAARPKLDAWTESL